MEIMSIGSSSSGNSYIIKTEKKNLLLDVGLSAKKITEAMSLCNIYPEDVDAVMITHEHIDHVRSVRTIARKCTNAVFYASHGTINGCSDFCHVPEDRLIPVTRLDEFALEDVRIRCFGLSHDAREPIGFSVIADGEQLTVVTDTGIVTDEIYREMLTADILVFEANHEESILMYGDYPYSVKMRIKSEYGHLSNVTAAEMLAKLLDDRCEAAGMRGCSLPTLSIMLAHLSEKNNTPFQARITIEDILRERGYENGEDYRLCIAAREGLCPAR